MATNLSVILPYTLRGVFISSSSEIHLVFVSFLDQGSKSLEASSHAADPEWVFQGKLDMYNNNLLNFPQLSVTRWYESLEKAKGFAGEFLLFSIICNKSSAQSEELRIQTSRNFLENLNESKSQHGRMCSWL